MWGTVRANLNNMVTGVTKGFEKDLELQGVGYRAAMKGKDLELSLGYSHPIVVKAPKPGRFKIKCAKCERPFALIVADDLTTKVGILASAAPAVNPGVPTAAPIARLAIATIADPPPRSPVAGRKRASSSS